MRVYTVNTAYAHLGPCIDRHRPFGKGPISPSRLSASEQIGRSGASRHPACQRALPRRKLRKGTDLDIIISNAGGKPIYEQIASQIKTAIITGELAEGSALPSIRVLANDLRISVITTKRAYAELEAQGLIETAQGKGSFVAGGNKELLREEQLKRVEALLAQAAEEARKAGICADEMREMLDLALER